MGFSNRKGSIIRGELNEAPICVSISTEDALFQVAVAPGQDSTGEQVTIDGKPRRLLPDAR